MMAADEFENESEASGKTLRERLEESIHRNKELESELLLSRAKDTISSKGFKYLKPEDLAGVSLPDLERKAEELNTAKAEERAKVIKEVLLEQGASEDEIEGAVAALLGKVPDEKAVSLSLLNQVTKVVGTPVATAAKADLFGKDRIEAELERKAKRSKR